jgi:hypothetical protein
MAFSRPFGEHAGVVAVETGIQTRLSSRLLSTRPGGGPVKDAVQVKTLPQQFGPAHDSAFPRYARAGLILLLLLGLAACSSTRLLYQNLDWLAFEAMDDRFEIRSDQEDWVKASLSNLHSWHRVNQLPAYRMTLSELQVRFADGLDAEDLAWLDESVEQHRRALVELVVPELSRFLADLDDAQLAHYAEASQASIDEAAEPLEWSQHERQTYRFETFVDRIEPWTGALSTSQLRLLEQDVLSLSEIRRDWIERRRERLRALTELLSTRPGQEIIEAALYDWWGDLDASYPPDYVAQRRQLKEQVFGLLVRLDTTLTQEQRAHVSDRLEGYLSTIDIVVASR